jgi:hypothetical protein
MFKSLRADKDAYINDRVVKGVRAYGSNTGIAGTLDVFKLYGATSSGSVPNTELSRLLVHFDLTALKQAVTAGSIDPTDSSFWAKLHLFDVYGGQPTPDNFTLSVTPLSQSFDEGRGKDVVYYSDYDECNFLTASRGNPWLGAGCTASGTLPGPCDYFTDLEATQSFVTGEEDLLVDVTPIIKGILSGTVPDAGFRIAFTAAEENDEYTRFVKRFASRHAYDDSKRPRLLVGFDDSIRDDSEGLTLDSNSNLFMWNYDKGRPANLMSGSSPVTGSNCLIVKLQLPVSGGVYELVFTGSQHSAGVNPVVGEYDVNVFIPSSDPVIAAAMVASGSSINLTPIWGSLDGTLAFLTASSAITVYPPTRGSRNLAPKHFVVTVNGLNSEHDADEIVACRVNLFDYTSPRITAVKIPVESPGGLQGVASDAFYSVRDVATDRVVIPYDTSKGSTRLSSDGSGMYFALDMSNLDPGRSYVVDVMVIVGGTQQRHPAASGVFKVNPVQ